MMIREIYPTLSDGHANVLGLVMIMTARDDVMFNNMFLSENLDSMKQQKFTQLIPQIKHVVSCMSVEDTVVNTKPKSQFTLTYARIFYCWLKEFMRRAGRDIVTDSYEDADIETVMQHSYDHHFTLFRIDRNSMLYFKNKVVMILMTEVEKDNVESYINTVKHRPVKDGSSEDVITFLVKRQYSPIPLDKFYHYVYIADVCAEMKKTKRIRSNIVVEHFYDVFMNIVDRIFTAEYHDRPDDRGNETEDDEVEEEEQEVCETRVDTGNETISEYGVRVGSGDDIFGDTVDMVQQVDFAVKDGDTFKCMKRDLEEDLENVEPNKKVKVGVNVDDYDDNVSILTLKTLG